MCGVRIAVAHLGEKALAGWWDTAFLDTNGFRYLELIYPKTTASASVMSASEAACRAHDERIGRGHVAHLFRLTRESETRLRDELFKLSTADLQKICSMDSALRLLDAASKGAKAVPGTGPVQVGVLKDLSTAAGLARMAATYASAFREGSRCFPYFT
jgi:hypothetical protein